jgi:CRP-like cAMP-binding protein
VLQAMPPAARATLARRCRWRRFAAGQRIVGHRDATRDVFCIVEGRVRATSFALSGREVSYRDIAAGGMVGEFSAIDGAPRSADVIALADTLVAAISAELFWQVLREHPEVAGVVLKSLTRQLRTLTERVFEFSTLAVNNRIHAELLRLARLQDAAGNTAVITPAPTHAELASRISTHREAVTRELNALARSGLVTRQGRSLRIADVAGLARMVELVLGEQR